MDRMDVRARARELLEQVYMTEPPGGGDDPGHAQLAALARSARSEGAPLDSFTDGPWRSDRCRFPHGGSAPPGELMCVSRGEFELPLPHGDAGEVAALLNWAEVPEPGAQT